MISMRPGATYIYERVDGVVYARELGSDPKTRFEIGRDYVAGVNISMKDWYDLLETSHTNPTLQDIVNQCIMTYRLIKEYKDGV